MSPAFDKPESRAGSQWLAAEGRAQQDALLVGLLSRFNHDLRTPLNTIIGWTHLLQQGIVDSARSRHAADVLARNAREQTVLLEEFVDDGRAVLGVLKLDTRTLRIADLVAQAMERAAPLFTLHAVTADASAAATDAETEGDERRTLRLVYRLLAAVARRTREATTLSVTTRRDGDAWLLSFDAAAGDADWSEAALLDLRVSSFVAGMHGGALAIDGTPGRAAVHLRLAAAR